MLGFKLIRVGKRSPSTRNHCTITVLQLFDYRIKYVRETVVILVLFGDL